MLCYVTVAAEICNESVFAFQCITRTWICVPAYLSSDNDSDGNVSLIVFSEFKMNKEQ